MRLCVCVCVTLSLSLSLSCFGDLFCWAHNFRKSKWGLSKWGLEVLVHNCPRLPAIVVILWRTLPLERDPKRPQTWTIVDDCAGKLQRVALSPHLLSPPFRARQNPEPRSEVWWWNLQWSFGGNYFDDFPQQKQLENLLPNFAGSSPPISPKTSPTSLWKSLVLTL